MSSESARMARSKTVWPEVHLSYRCPDCRMRWSITARLRRDDACPRCGAVSLPIRTEEGPA
ncbi:hypothetical protein [Rhodosalinus sediminis]|uniref:hypothetical protein n=1 Tax=Rhodosalinus sediminis TaxID=1940533 RepID=UPI002357C837|nr:hypothetical protein [Rhodosalinus sediminis]